MKVQLNASVMGIIVLTVTILLLGLAGGSSSNEQEERVMEHIKKILSKDVRTRNQGVDEILQDRKITIEKLIPLIDPTNATKYSDETRCAAAFVLGELRAIEAVPVLSMALANEPGPKIKDDISRFDVPVCTALVKIGRPSIPAMIENIETSDNEILLNKSMDVLNHVLGGKRRLLELLGNLEVRAAKNELKAQRIKKAAKWAQDHYQESEEPLY